MSKTIKRQITVNTKLDQLIQDIGVQIDNDFDEELSISEAYRKVLVWAVQKWKKEQQSEVSSG